MLEDRISVYRDFEVYNPALKQHIKTELDVEYFPNGNDPFLFELTEACKHVILDKVNQL